MLLIRDREFVVVDESAEQDVSASVCKSIVCKNRSSILPKDDNGVDCKDSLTLFMKSLLMNSIQESSQLATSGSTSSTLVRETKKALAASCPTAFLKSSMIAISRSCIRCGTSSAMSTRCLDLKLTSQIGWVGLPNLEVGKSISRRFVQPYEASHLKPPQATVSIPERPSPDDYSFHIRFTWCGTWERLVTVQLWSSPLPACQAALATTTTLSHQWIGLAGVSLYVSFDFAKPPVTTVNYSYPPRNGFNVKIVNAVRFMTRREWLDPRA